MGPHDAGYYSAKAAMDPLVAGYYSAKKAVMGPRAAEIILPNFGSNGPARRGMGPRAAEWARVMRNGPA